MYTPNTFILNKNQFVDTYGFFALCNDSEYVFHVPKGMRYGKLKKYSGYQVTLSIVTWMHYGLIIEIKETNRKSNLSIKSINLEEYKERLEKFNKYSTWVTEKRKEGIKLFDYLRQHNPIYIQRNKNWIKSYNLDSKIGSYIIVKINDNKGKLRPLFGRECIFIVTYNRGYNNGFLVLPID